MINQLEMTAIIKAKEGQEENLKKAIQECVAYTVEEPGCLEFKVFQTHDNPRLFILWEIFKDQEALEEHIRADYTQKYFANPYLDSTEVFKTSKI